MGYGDWVDLHLTDTLPGLPVQVKNSELQWYPHQSYRVWRAVLKLDHRGKFYADGDKDREISPQQVDETVVPANSSASADVYSCGREDAASGTQGSFDLIDQNFGTTICSLQWNCPYNPGPGNWNLVEAQNLNSDYSVTIGEYNKKKGALKTIDVNIGAA